MVCFLIAGHIYSGEKQEGMVCIIILMYVTIATWYTLYLKFRQANHPVSDSQTTNYTTTVDDNSIL